jgi:spore coat polysaccharide biosynthesis predicted glycosyltransferase SpsG
MVEREIQAVILTEAGRARGNGHLARCTGLLEAFHEAGRWAQMWVDIDQPLPDGFSAYKSAAIGDWKKDLERFLPSSGRRNLIAVVDSYEADLALLKAIASRSRSCCFFDDFARLDYPDGTLVNAAIEADSLYPIRSDGLRYLTGPRYAVLRKAFGRKRSFRIREIIGQVLVALGSSVPAQHILGVIAALRDFLPAATIKVLHESAIHSQTPASEVDWLWSLSPEQLVDLALDCDLAICSGGQILLELASLGVPAATIATAENQRSNVAGLERAGFSIHLGELGDSPCLDKLKSAMPVLAKAAERRLRSNRGRHLIDGHGATRIVRVLEKLPYAGNS